MPKQPGKDRLAVLIDADNAQASLFAAVFSEIASLGLVSAKRIYGDFTSPNNAQWRKILQEFAIRPCQQFAYTKGKNATDGALIIDAMDLLHSGLYDGFCIISSDSDYTSLAVRIRESGLKVYGFGRSNTPDAFKNACDKFIKLEVLDVKKENDGVPGPQGADLPNPPGPAQEGNGEKDKKQLPAPQGKGQNPAPAPPAEKKGGAPSIEPFPLALIRDAIEKISDDTGWACLANLGHYLVQIKKDFDPRDYGCTSSKLSFFIKKFSHYLESKWVPQEKGRGDVIYVRLRDTFK